MLLGSTAAIGDLKSMWKELADVAPKEIQTDTEKSALSGNFLATF